MMAGSDGEERQLALAYKNMLDRCYNPNNKSHHHYGGRGIVVCDLWRRSRKSFLVWARENGFRRGLTLDRVDNNGIYSPENSRWTTVKQQLRNQRRNILVEKDGAAYPIGEWCELLGLDSTQMSKVYKRRKYGADTYNELFCDHLRSHRTDQRDNRCDDCGTEESCKWRKYGTQCNTCYHRVYRAKLTEKRLSGL